MAVVETERLVLEKLTIEDAEFILGLVNEPSFLANIGDRGVTNLKQARQYILDGPVDSYKRYGFGMFLTRIRKQRTPVGVCGLVKREGLDYVDIGFAFKPQFWGQGFARESSAAVIDFARTRVGLKRIVAITNPDNTGSIRVLEKLGLRFEKNIRLPEGETEIRLYAMEL